MYNLNKPLPLSRSKKGALELSINAIVVLILAITMLSLGLAFMKGLFKKTTGQLEQVGEDIKNQMVEQLRSSSAKLTLNQEDITLKKGETREIYYGIKNVETAEGSKSYPIAVECGTPLGGGSPLTTGDGGAITTFAASRQLGQGEIDVQKMIISIPSNADRKTHSCELKVGDNGAYAKKSFFVTVE